MPISPTQNTLKHLRKQGYTCQIVEHWNPFARVRNDLFGFIDVLAVKEGETLAVQTTTAGNMSARVKKIGESEHIGAVRDAGWTIHVHGWVKKNNRWQVRVVDVS